MPFVDAALGERATFEAEPFGRLLEALDQAVVITAVGLEQPGPTITYVNGVFERMTGYARHEVIGETPRLLQGPETSRAELDRMRGDLMSGRTFDGEILNYRKNGDTFWLKWVVIPILDDFSRTVAWLSIQTELDTPSDQLRHVAVETERQMREIKND